MFTRILVLGVCVMGAAGQWACSETAEAAPEDANPRGGQFCGGFAAIQCPEGLMCVDDPSDDCDPEAGGRDCGGICVEPTGPTKPGCDYRDPRLSYVSRDPAQCAAILFKCPGGTTAFFNDCGCGCQSLASCCNYRDPNRRYLSREPARCAALRFVCNPGEAAFFDDCGCGCERVPAP